MAVDQAGGDRRGVRERRCLTNDEGNPIPKAYQRAFDDGEFAEMLAHFCHEGGVPVNKRETDGHLCSWGSFPGENPDERYQPTPEEYGRAILQRIEKGWCGC